MTPTTPQRDDSWVGIEHTDPGKTDISAREDGAIPSDRVQPATCALEWITGAGNPCMSCTHFSVAKGRLQRISNHFVTYMPISVQCCGCIETWVEHITNWAHSQACGTTINPPTFLPIFFDNIILLHRVPQAVVSDRDVPSVSNGSKLAVRFRVWVGTELEPLQWVIPHQKTEPHQSRSFFASFSFSHRLNFGFN